MKRALQGAVAASALIVLAACGGAEDADTDMTEDIAPPPVTAPADTMMADTMLIDTMVDTMTTTTGM